MRDWFVFGALTFPATVAKHNNQKQIVVALPSMKPDRYTLARRLPDRVNQWRQAMPLDERLMFEEQLPPVVIPHLQLSAEILQAVIESFVLREGTEYGATEFSLDQKVAHVMRQLERGEAQIIFDPNTDSVDIVVAPKFV